MVLLDYWRLKPLISTTRRKRSTSNAGQFYDHRLNPLRVVGRSCYVRRHCQSERRQVKKLWRVQTKSSVVREVFSDWYEAETLDQAMEEWESTARKYGAFNSLE